MKPDANHLQRIRYLDESLPHAYRRFDLNRAPNPKLCQHVFDFWRRFSLVEDFHHPPPGDWFGFGDTIGQDSRTGLLLFGPPRCGKTRLACEAVRRLVAAGDDLQGGRFLSAVRWAADTSSRARRCELEDWVDETLGFAWRHDCDHAYLILDDLDKLRATDSVQACLFDLIETATTHNITLVVTTNCGAGELQDKFDRAFGEAIVARLKEFCTPINCSVPAHEPGQAPAVGPVTGGSPHVVAGVLNSPPHRPKN